MTEQVLNREGHHTALETIYDKMLAAQTALTHGQTDRYKAHLQSAFISLQVLIQQEVGK